MGDNLVCLNCGSNHETLDCNDPNLWIKCPRCLVSSMDGTGHSLTCRLAGTTSGIRSNIYALKPLDMFMMRTKNLNDELYFLNNETNSFEIVKKSLTLLANAVDGVFKFGKATDGRMLIQFMGTSIKRFAIAFAFFNENDWRYRFRAVVTHQEGVLCFPMQRSVEKCDQKYIFPDQDHNTVLVLGIRTSAAKSRIGFRVFANENGTPFGNPDDDIYGHVTWSPSMDLIEISPNLSSGGNKKSLRFTRLLYENDKLNTMADVSKLCFFIIFNTLMKIFMNCRNPLQ